MRRSIIEVFPPRLRKVWSEWQLRVVVLISLILQTVLIIFGSRRKYIARTWIKFVVWSAYLAADSVATFALGVISSHLRCLHDDDDQHSSVNADVELYSFWAPFLLLHLGGPDTITAYSLEDNDLWLRHFLGLVVQALGTFYIFLMARTSSFLSILTIPMIFAGLIKYGERTWVLRSASSDRLRDSMRVTHSDPSLGDSNLIEEYDLRVHEGYNVIPNRVTEVQLPMDSVLFEGDSISKDSELLTAYGLFQIFKCLFVDLILGTRDRDTSQTIFRSISSESAFKLIEMECGFMYDLLHTKAMLVYNPWGFGLRFVSFALTCIVLVLFSLATEKQHYSKIDRSITFLLLVVAIFLEIYATIMSLSSDWTIVWSSMHDKTSVLQASTSLQLFRNPRWSNSMAQYSLLGFTLKEKPMVCHKMLNRFSIVEVLERQRYITSVEVPNTLKEWIFKHLKEKLKKMQREMESGTYNLGALNIARGSNVLQDYGHGNDLKWSTEVEFDESIFIWHIATEICCDLEDSSNQSKLKLEMSKLMSQYMLYLVVMKPSMLPVRIAQFIFEDTCAEAVKFYSTEGKTHVHRKLLEHYTTGVEVLGERYRSKKSVLSNACRLAADLTSISDKEEVISSSTSFLCACDFLFLIIFLVV